MNINQGKQNFLSFFTSPDQFSPYLSPLQAFDSDIYHNDNKDLLDFHLEDSLIEIHNY